MSRRNLRALAWFTASLQRRLLREPQVVRSLLWPIALGPITLVSTVLVWVWIEGVWPIAVHDLSPEITTALQDEGWVLIEVEEPRTLVARGRYNHGTDGHTVFAARDRGRTLELERVLREAQGAPWASAKPVPPSYQPKSGERVTSVLGFLFVLFGVVFGAGMVARDREDGTLEAELALGVASWVHGTARWIAATSVLTMHFLLAIAVIDAMMGIENPFRLARHALSACAGSVAIGLFVIGRGGLKSGFSGPLAAGIGLATVLVTLGVARMPMMTHVPIASLLAGGEGWTTLIGALVMGGLAIVLFTFRSARA